MSWNEPINVKGKTRADALIEAIYEIKEELREINKTNNELVKLVKEIKTKAEKFI